MNKIVIFLFQNNFRDKQNKLAPPYHGDSWPLA